jgi:hypothetical protein
VRHEELKLRDWSVETRDNDEAAISEALRHIPAPIEDFLEQIAVSLAQFDWRTVNAEGLTDEEKLRKLVFRGSGGYSEFRRQLLKHISNSGGQAARAAKLVLGMEPKRKPRG